MRQRIKLNENDLYRIVETELKHFIKNPHMPKYMQVRDKDREFYEHNKEIVNSVIKSITDKLHNEITYLKYNGHFENLNPMFIDKMPNGRQKKQNIAVQKIISKCQELYNFLQDMKDEF